MIRKPLVLTTVALGLALTACTSTSTSESTPTTTDSPWASPTGLYSEPSEPSELSEPSESSEGFESTSVEPGESEGDSLINNDADDDAVAGAADAALATATVWVQGTTLDQDTWNTQLLDTIAPVARPAYDNQIWGYRIPATTVTGDPDVTEATMTTATVTVPTDAGDLTLTVTRDDEAAPWLTTSITN